MHRLCVLLFLLTESNRSKSQKRAVCVSQLSADAPTREFIVVVTVTTEAEAESGLACLACPCRTSQRPLRPLRPLRPRPQRRTKPYDRRGLLPARSELSRRALPRWMPAAYFFDRSIQPITRRCRELKFTGASPCVDSAAAAAQGAPVSTVYCPVSRVPRRSSHHLLLIGANKRIHTGHLHSPLLSSDETLLRVFGSRPRRREGERRTGEGEHYCRRPPAADDRSCSLYSPPPF